MRLPIKLFSFIFLAIFVSISLIFAPFSHAASGTTLLFDLATQPKTVNDYLKEYCDKRSGDLMNLETWYSGKCSPTTDTISGDGVGFSDIVILQGLEYINGPQYDSFFDSIVRMLKGLVTMKEKLSQGNPPPQNLSISNQGLVPFLASVTTSVMNTKPASSIDYLAYVSSNLKNHNVINQAYAVGPGYGFTSLSPILPLWRAFRNIAYLLFALGFVLYGVMIMFRVKIDAKTAASVQLAIPKLIVTLLIITFSYAIVGFLIDISTVISAMVIGVLKAGGILADVNNPIPLVASGQSIFGALGSIIVNTFTAVIVSPFIVFNLLIGGATGIIIAGITGVLSFTSWVGFFGVLVVMAIQIAISLSFIKLIFKLFQAYFSVIINLIFSPIILLGNLMPGSNAIGAWIMSIVGNLAVFPVASFFLVLSYALMVQPLLSLMAAIGSSIPGITIGPQGFEALLGVKTLSTLNNIWTPPMTIPTGATTGTAMGSVGSLMLATIGFGLLMMASKYCEMVEKALKTPPFPYGAAIGEALKGGYKGVGMIPSVGNADWYKRTSRATGLPAGTPINAPFPPQTPTVTP